MKTPRATDVRTSNDAWKLCARVRVRICMQGSQQLMYAERTRPRSFPLVLTWTEDATVQRLGPWQPLALKNCFFTFCTEESVYA